MGISGVVMLRVEGFTGMENEAWKRQLNKYGRRMRMSNSAGFEIP